jgi:DHA2 family multidrug resistance protein
MGAAAITMNEAAEWRSPVNPWIIALVVTLATFMEVLDTSIANVALPHIAGSLSAGQDESTWILTSYLVSNAIVLPLSGWLSSIIGRKHFYMGCVALFTISSFLCGLAPNLGMLIFFRVIQGAGGGGLQPSSQAILADTFPPAKRGMAFAVYGIAVVMAPAVGPTLGGWLTDNFSWRWIFFINIPVGILSLLLNQRLIQDPPYFRRRKLSETRIDYIGLGLIALGLGTLQVVLDKGQREDWFESHFIVGLSVISAVSLIFVIFWEWNHKDPIVELHLFRQRTFAVSNFLMFMLGFVLLGSTLLLPLFMQTMLGYTAERSGMALSPGGFVIMLMMPLVGFLLSRYSPRWLLVFGLSMLSFSLFHMTTFDLSVDFRTMIMARVYQGIGLAFLFVPINTAAYSSLPRDKNNAASGLMNLARNIGGSFGISFVTTGLSRRAQFHQARLVENLNAANPQFRAALHGMTGTFSGGGAGPGSGGGSALQHAYAMMQASVIQQATMLAYIDNFWVLGVVIVCLIPCVFLIKKSKPGGDMVAH